MPGARRTRLALSGDGAGEQHEPLGARAAGLGVIDDQRLTVGVGDREMLAPQLQRAHLGVLHPRRAAALWMRAMASPELAKALAANRELTHQELRKRRGISAIRSRSPIDPGRPFGGSRRGSTRATGPRR